MLTLLRRNGRLLGDVLMRLAELCPWILVVTVLPIIFVVSPLLGILIVVGGLWFFQSNHHRTSGTHGTAQWASIRDLQSAGCLNQQNGLPLGNAVGLTAPTSSEVRQALLRYPLRRSGEAVEVAQSRRRMLPRRLFAPDRNPHLAVFGPSGSGKTTCYVQRWLFQNSDNAVVLDVKGELAVKSARYRHRMFGHRIIILDPFNIAANCGFPRSRFNPLDLFRDNQYQLVDEARRIANAIVVKTGQEHDPFWPQYATTLITAICAFLMACAKPEEANLNRLRDIICSPKILDQAMQFMLESEACGGLLQRLAGQLLQCQGQTKASAHSVAASHVDFLDSLSLAEMFSESTFDAREILTGKCTIYLCLPVDRITEMCGVQRLLVSSLINLVFSAGEDRHRRVRMYLDEAATLGPMDCLYNAVQFGRSFGLRMHFLFQATSQVERCFPESQKDDFFATVPGVYCSTSDYRTAKDVSEWMGESTIMTRSQQDGTNWGGSATTGVGDQSRNVNWGGSGSTSYSEHGRSLLKPEEILQLPRNLAIVLLPNVPPILTVKVPMFEAPSRRVQMFDLRRLWSLFCAAITVTVTVFMVWVVISGHQHPLAVDLGRHLREQLLE